MELQELVNLFVNNSVSIAVIVYFCIRDWKFQSSLQSTLTTLVNTTETLKELIKEKE